MASSHQRGHQAVAQSIRFALRRILRGAVATRSPPSSRVTVYHDARSSELRATCSSGVPLGFASALLIPGKSRDAILPKFGTAAAKCRPPAFSSRTWTRTRDLLRQTPWSLGRSAQGTAESRLSDGLETENHLVRPPLPRSAESASSEFPMARNKWAGAPEVGTWHCRHFRSSEQFTGLPSGQHGSAEHREGADIGEIFQRGGVVRGGGELSTSSARIDPLLLHSPHRIGMRSASR
jgi:hypothetical protein